MYSFRSGVEKSNAPDCYAILPIPVDTMQLNNVVQLQFSRTHFPINKPVKPFADNVHMVVFHDRLVKSGLGPNMIFITLSYIRSRV